MKVSNGTILQKIVRFRNYAKQTSINNILLISLPVTTPHRILAQSQGAASTQQSNIEKVIQDEPKDWLRDSVFSNIGSVFLSGRNKPTLTPYVFGEEEFLGGKSRETLQSGRESVIAPQPQNFSLSSSKLVEKSKIRFSEDMYVSLEEFSFVQTQFTTYIKEIIKKNEVELIFSSESIPATLFEELKELGIVVIFPVTSEDLNLLSKVVKAKIVDDVGAITKELDQKYLGNIRKYSLVNLVDNNTYNSTLVYLEKLEPVLNEQYSSLGVTLYSSNASKNTQLKTFLRDNLVHLYYSLCEHEMINAEKDSIAKPTSTTIIKNEQVGVFKNYLIDIIPNFRKFFLPDNQEVFEFTRVELEASNSFNTYPDISNEFTSMAEKFFTKLGTLEGIKNIFQIENKIVTALEKPQEYGNFMFLYNTESEPFANLNTTKNDMIMTMTETPSYQCYRPYSNKDETLGKFVKRLLREYDEGRAQEDWNQYQVLYYIAGKAVKISFSSDTKRFTKEHLAKTMKENGKKHFKVGLKKYLMHVGYPKAAPVETNQTSRGFNVFPAHIRGLDYRQALPLENNSRAPFNQMRPSVPTQRITFGGAEEMRLKKEKEKKIQANLHKKDNPQHHHLLKSYVVCDTCHKVLSKTMVFDSTHKNMSFLAFLFCLANSESQNQSLLNSSINKSIAGGKSFTLKDFEGMDQTSNLSRKEIHNSDTKAKFCNHSVQARAFSFGHPGSGSSMVKINSFDTTVHSFLHFKHREKRGRGCPELTELQKQYRESVILHEDKMAMEIFEYLIRQISFLTFLFQDLVCKANTLIGEGLENQTKVKGFQEVYRIHTKIVIIYFHLSDLVIRINFSMKYFRKLKTNGNNHMLRSLVVAVQNYESLLRESYELLVGEHKQERKSLYFCDVVVKLAQIIKNLMTKHDPKEDKKKHESKKSSNIFGGISSIFNFNTHDKVTVL